MDDQGKSLVTYPTPRKTGPGDYNFVVTVQLPEFDVAGVNPGTVGATTVVELPTTAAVDMNTVTVSDTTAIELLTTSTVDVNSGIASDTTAIELPTTSSTVDMNPVIVSDTTAIELPTTSSAVDVNPGMAGEPSGQLSDPIPSSSGIQIIKLPVAKKIKQESRMLLKRKLFQETMCQKCGVVYDQKYDNRKYGRWIGCEEEEKCGTWVHRKCIGWSEKDVDSKKFWCDACLLTKN